MVTSGLSEPEHLECTWDLFDSYLSSLVKEYGKSSSFIPRSVLGV